MSTVTVYTAEYAEGDTVFDSFSSTDPYEVETWIHNQRPVVNDDARYDGEGVFVFGAIRWFSEQKEEVV